MLCYRGCWVSPWPRGVVAIQRVLSPGDGHHRPTPLEEGTLLKRASCRSPDGDKLRFCCNPPSLLTLRLALHGRLGISYGDGRKLPLAIMVSDDTRDRTQEMLELEQWFGMEEGQVTLMKQEKVAAIQVRIEGMVRPERRHCCPSSCRVGVHPENRSGISSSLALPPAFR